MNNYDDEKRPENSDNGALSDERKDDRKNEVNSSSDGNDFYSREYEKRQAESQAYDRNFNNQSYSNGNDRGGYTYNPYAGRGKSPSARDYEAAGKGKAIYNLAQAETAQKREHSKFITGLVFALVILLAFVLGMCCSGGCSGITKSSMVDDIMEKLKDNYLFDYNEELLEYYAALGISTQLDAYSRILSPQEYYDLMNATDPEVYGISYSQQDGKWIVKTVLLDSPADFAVSESGEVGIRKGDELYAVGEVNLSSKTREEVVALLNVATVESLIVKRGTELITFKNISRRLVDSRYVEYFFMGSNGDIYTNMKYYFEENGVTYTNMDNGDGKVNYYSGTITNPEYYPHYKSRNLSVITESSSKDIGYICLEQFSYTAREMSGMRIIDFGNAMDAFLTAYGGKGKLILDLRDNPGGYNNYCLSVASYFTYNGKDNENLRIYRMIDKNGNEVGGSQTSIITRYDDYFDTTAKGEQIVVLTSENSASASEMLTGAMLTYGTAIQVGQQTYGKGISQTVEPLKYVKIEVDGQMVQSAYALYYTFAYFYTPDVAGSTSKYNNYCNQSDRNGDGKIGEGESKMGFMPETENLRTGNAECLTRALELLNK